MKILLNKTNRYTNCASLSLSKIPDAIEIEIWSQFSSSITCVKAFYSSINWVLIVEAALER